MLKKIKDLTIEELKEIVSSETLNLTDNLTNIQLKKLSNVYDLSVEDLNEEIELDSFQWTFYFRNHCLTDYLNLNLPKFEKEDLIKILNYYKFSNALIYCYSDFQWTIYNKTAFLKEKNEINFSEIYSIKFRSSYGVFGFEKHPMPDFPSKIVPTNDDVANYEEDSEEQ